MNSIQLYRSAVSIEQMDESKIPIVSELTVTRAIYDHYAPWAHRESSAPKAMAFRHWADLIRSIVYGPKSSIEKARLGDPIDYRTLNYLKVFAAAHMVDWVREAEKIDPIKGYKLARQMAKPILKEEASKFRLAIQLLEEDMYTGLDPDFSGFLLNA